MLTEPIPKAAMPVVRVIRRDVPRPKKLPTLFGRSLALRFCRFHCPMGLHPKAKDRTPIVRADFPPCSDMAIAASGGTPRQTPKPQLMPFGQRSSDD